MQGIYHEMMAFCECILSEEKPGIGSLEFALEVMLVYEAALRSNGRTVQIPR